MTGPATDLAPHSNDCWVGTWATSPHGPYFAGTEAPDITIRQIVRSTIGGDRIRVHFSNAFGTKPLLVGAARIAVHDSGSSVVPGSDRSLTFQGQPGASIECGNSATSDGIDFKVPPFCDLALSIYLPGKQGVSGSTVHYLSLQTCYISPSIGNCTGAITLPIHIEMNFWYALTGVDVRPLGDASAVVTIGDCFTDGACATPRSNGRWTNILAERLHKSNRNIAVLNAGISGNRLLRNGPHPFESMFGASALTRFDRDVLTQAGAKYVIIALGGGDLTHPGSSAPYAESVHPERVIEGLLQLVRRSRSSGLKVIGGTLTPIEGGHQKGFPPAYSPHKEKKRQAVNDWIRNGGAYDAVIDFDAIVRDPSRPSWLNPAYDFDDHLHLNDVGHQAVGDAIDLEIFR
jgi:lysophospholipase L1-like esterase